MDNIGYISLSAAAMLERTLDVTANNLANANTGGFRASRNAFEELLADTRRSGDRERVSYALDRSYVDMAAGALEQTGNPLDLAIRGSAWFGYQGADGTVGLGRDGRFAVDQEGMLRTSAGLGVLDAGGGPVMIPPGSGDITIAADGTIVNEDGQAIGQVGLFDEPQIAAWLPAGDGMFVPPQGAAELAASIDSTMIQGFTEGSNVNSVLEMTRMIDVQRAYDRSMTLANGADELRKQTLARLGKPST